MSEEELKEKRANLTGQALEGHKEKKSRKHELELSHINNRNSVISSVNSSGSRKGLVLPFTPLSLTFNNTKYSVDMPEVNFLSMNNERTRTIVYTLPKFAYSSYIFALYSQAMKAQGVTEDRLLLLKGVSGSFRPGVLTALMGVSGAGKTTLMDVLAGRKTGGYIEGDITVSGYPKKQETFARISGYCEQNDIHSPHVTVYESLVFSAWLRLPVEVDSEKRKVS
jgi:ABC-type glutathione transport system ATPase component